MKKKKLLLRMIYSGKLDKNGIRRLNYLKEKGVWTWLTIIQSVVCSTVLSSLIFKDELRDRYGLKILNKLSYCEGCTTEFLTTHALSCKVGGLIRSRRDESRDTLGCLAYVGFQPSNVRDELLINPWRNIEGTNDGKIVESQTGLEIEIDRSNNNKMIKLMNMCLNCISDVIF